MKPNVILFIVDQLAAKWFEAARNENICAPPPRDMLTSCYLMEGSVTVGSDSRDWWQYKRDTLQVLMMPIWGRCGEVPILVEI